MPKNIRIHLGASFHDTWREVAHPWFERAVKSALASELPWVVLTPGQALGLSLKAQLLASDRSVGGLYFWNPGELRDYMRGAARNESAIAVREHLHLLLGSLAAEQSDEPAVKAIERDPSRMLRSLDQLYAGGHPSSELGFAPAEKLAQQLAASLKKLGWSTVQQHDWQTALNPATALFGGVLIMGFDAAHSELWPLLQAAVSCARETDVVLTRPRSKAEDLDQVWVGTWEEQYGEHEPIAEEAQPGVFAPLAQRMENPEAAFSKSASQTRILIGRNLREQAEAIVAQCAEWLARGNVERLGILLPGPGPLAREVSVQLNERKLSHFDSFGHPAPPSSSTQRWRAWIALQRAYTIPNLHRLVSLAPDLNPPDKWADQVDRARNETLVDDIPVVAARLQQLDQVESAAFLRRFAALPAKESLKEMLDQTRSAWLALRWQECLDLLEPQAAAVAAMEKQTVSSSLFLDWLDALLPKPTKQRDEESANPLARIHLLPYSHAEGLPWSHLIMADLNEGQWPPSFESETYLSDRQITALNHASLATGRQGEGHTVLKSGRALMQGPNERNAICRRQFYNLVESVTDGLALTCALEGDDGKGRILPVSNFLSHLYFTERSKPLSEQAMLSLQVNTANWLAGVPAPDARAIASQPLPVEQAKTAYDARRTGESFGPYECAFSEPPKQAITLSCKDWQEAVVDPAALWMKKFLGVKPAGDERSSRWPIARGSWVHDWLARAVTTKANTFEKRASGKDIPDATARAALATRKAVGAAFTAGGRRITPEWWTALWSQAAWTANSFARRLAEVEGWPWAATEWSLPKDCVIPLVDHPLRLRGRMDLLFCKENPNALPDLCWLADFKTGADRALSPKNYLARFKKGEGIQLALYALALEACGARDVSISLLKPDTTVIPQITLLEVHEALTLWDELARMQDAGIFGMRGALRTEYGRGVVMPIATLPIDGRFWEDKWLKTHAAFSDEEGSYE